MDAAKRITLNTGVLYVQLIINMVIGFVTVPIVLRVLGEESYGTYMLVAGVVGMLGILNSSMSNTSMRFLAYWLGSKDLQKVKQVFNTTILIHIVFGLASVVIMEIGGWIMFEYVVNIPEDSVMQAKIVYQMMILSTYITIVAVPYDAVMNAHENMVAMSIIEVVFKIVLLILVLCLSFFHNYLIILYGAIQLIVTLLIRFTKQTYATRKYEECRHLDLKTSFDINLFKEIISFTWWNLFGSLASIVGSEIRGIIINHFCGVRLNAAEGVSKNVTGIVNQVATSMTRAMNPVMTKKEGAGDRDGLIRMVETGSKFSCFLLAIFGIPVLIEADTLLKLWLGNVPEFAVVFCQIAIFSMLFEKMSFQITNAIRAVGNVKHFQIAETVIILCNLPLYLIVLSIGLSPIATYWVGVVTTLCCMGIRLYFGRKVVGISPLLFLLHVPGRMLPSLVISASAGLICFFFIPESLLIVRITCTFLFSMGTLILSFYYLSLSVEERKIVLSIINPLIDKLLKKMNGK